MKKLLSLLGASVITTSGVAPLMAMSQYETTTKQSISSFAEIETIKEKTEKIINIGRNIDKSKAIDDAKSNLQFTNYYILGDSLSDSHGLEKLTKKYLSLSFKVGTNDESNLEDYQYGSFTNGKPAGVLLNDWLGFDEIKPGIPNDNDYDFGRNYAIGCATANDIDDDEKYTLLLNKVTIEKQARALVSQHKLRKTDLVFMEIGSNDLFYLCNKKDFNYEEKLLFIEKSVKRIQEALFILLNNDIQKIIFSDPPDSTLFPEIRFLTSEEKEEQINLSKEFNLRIKDMIKLVNRYYKNAVREWGFYKNLPILMKEFKDKNKNAKFDDFFNIMFWDLTGVNLLKSWENKKIISDYFFFDPIHPTYEVHKLAAEHYYEIVSKWK